MKIKETNVIGVGKIQMDEIKRYLRDRQKSYFFNAIFFILIFSIVIFFFGPPRYYVVPILSMIIGYGIVEFHAYKLWKKVEF